MKNILKYALGTLALSVFTALTVSAQKDGDYIIIDGERYQLKRADEPQKPQPATIVLEEPATETQVLQLKTVRERKLRVDWKPRVNTEHRYTVGIRPLELVNFGLKADFGFELNRPGRWLNFELSGYFAPQYDGRYDDSYYGYSYGWNSFVSGFNYFNKMKGAGLAITYKNIFARRGWYVAFTGSFNYFDVDFNSEMYGRHPFTDKYGQVYYEDRYDIVRRDMQFYKLGFSVNMGKHFAVSKHFYFDLFGGLGVNYSIYDRSRYDNLEYGHYYYDGILSGDGIYSFGYRGITITGGVRLGILWRKPTVLPVN